MHQMFHACKTKGLCRMHVCIKYVMYVDHITGFVAVHIEIANVEDDFAVAVALKDHQQQQHHHHQFQSLVVEEVLVVLAVAVVDLVLQHQEEEEDEASQLQRQEACLESQLEIPLVVLLGPQASFLQEEELLLLLLLLAVVDLKVLPD